MVSKRKPSNNKEAGPSKKKLKSDDKVIQPEDNQLSQSKKKVKKPKVAKEKNEKVIQEFNEEIKSSKTDKEKNDKIEIHETDNNKKIKVAKDKNEKANQQASDDDMEVKEEISPELDINENTEKPDITHSNPDLPRWPVDHMSELLRRIEFVLPQRETLTYKSRIEKINWDEIAFNGYSGAECRLMWDGIQKRVRRYRILRELIEDAKTWISKPWTNFYRGSKTNRHPDLPRRPLSTYMIFYLKKKDKVLQEHPGLDMTELSKHIAEMYKKLSAKSKLKYKEMAVAQRKEYDEKMKEFTRLHPELVRTTGKKEKAVTVPVHDDVPVKPLTPFKIFYEDRLKRVEHDEDFEKATFIEKCKEQWRTMDDKKKVFWINWALDKEAKYQEDIKKYVAENPDYVPINYKPVVTKEERSIRERMAGKPEKPPNSAYSLFSRLMLVSEDIKSVSPRERMLLIAQQWKNCSVLEKKGYADRVKHMLEQYKLQYAEYLESLPEEERQLELLNNQPKRKKVTKTKSQSSAESPEKKTPKPKAKKSNVKAKVQQESKKDDTLFHGEPAPPPATPFLLFLKSYQSNYPDKSDAQEVWENMTEEKRSMHREVLWDMKRIYIESYENFLKGLTQEELKEYSEWKKSLKPKPVSDESSDSESSDSEKKDSDSDNDDKGIKKEAPDDSDSSD